MRIGLVVLLFACLVISIGCRKGDQEAKPKKTEPTNVVTPMNIQTDNDDDK